MEVTKLVCLALEPDDSVILPMDLHETTNPKQKAALFRLSRFSQAYRIRLLTGVKDLDAYCKQETGNSLERWCKSVDRVDGILGEYVMAKHADRKKNPLALVKHAILGAQHLFPVIKGKIPNPHMGGGESK